MADINRKEWTVRELWNRLTYCWLVLRRGRPVVKIGSECKTVASLEFRRVGLVHDGTHDVTIRNCIFDGAHRGMAVSG